MDAGTVAVSWDGGKLTNQQLNDMVMRRRMLNAFLQQVEMQGSRSAYEAGVEPSQLRVQRLLGPESPEQGVERSVVETKLAAEAAREAGMRVSDESIVRYLDQLGRGNVTRDTMRYDPQPDVVARRQAFRSTTSWPPCARKCSPRTT